MLSGRSYGGRPARSWPSSTMRAGGRRLEAGQHPQQRRLAAARRAEQREDLALGDVEADVVDGPVAVEVLDDVLDLEKRRGLHRVEEGAKPAIVHGLAQPTTRWTRSPGRARRQPPTPGRLGGRVKRSGRPQAIVLNTSASVPTIWSMCDFSMISGGDSAIVSPVVRISRPRSQAAEEHLEAALARLAGARRQLDPADQADVAHVDDVRRLAQRVQRLRQYRLHLLGPRQQAFLGIGVERAERRRRRPAGGPSRCSRGRTRSRAPARS